MDGRGCLFWVVVGRMEWRMEESGNGGNNEDNGKVLAQEKTGRAWLG
jgi:hypothetical protein